ncbi:hypothetical protein [Streptomyces spiralis]|uniref:hypothetical protein n=1 Tax=Streptomyces spiralis TaxID=66376 RepID=UPI0033C22F45
MHPGSGLFPITSELSNPSFYKATEAERGLTMLAHYAHITNGHRYADAQGWHRFNETAPRWAGELVRDVLSYVLSHAGGVDAVWRAIEVLTELAATDAGVSDEEGASPRCCRGRGLPHD